MGGISGVFAPLGRALLGALILVLAGCGGNDGSTGPQGTIGPAGPPGIRAFVPTALDVTITGVTINSAPVVHFKVVDQDGLGFNGLEPGEASFTIAKLEPGPNGDTNRWRNYIRDDDGGMKAIQSGADSSGTLVNNGDGTYTYTFATDITKVSGIPYDPTLTHRVGMEIRGTFLSEELPGANAEYTWQPSTGATTGITNRKIVAQASCNSCHGKLEAHGEGRFDVDYCVTCHQPDSYDYNPKNGKKTTMDFRVMIHKIHMGEDLPSVVAGGDYSFCGFGCENFGSPATSFKDVKFPQDVRNCTKCHDPSDSATPQASNITQRPSRAACGACHDDVNFATGANHGPNNVAVQDDSECTVCHRDNSVAPSVVTAHVIDTKVAAGRFKYNILSVSNTAQGQTPTVRFSITDPTNGGAAYDVLNDPEFDKVNGAGVNLDLAWSTSDYTNFDPVQGAVTGGPPSRPISIDMLDSANVVDNSDGTFTLTSPIAIPASGVSGSGAVAMEGHPLTTVNGTEYEAPVTGAVKYFAITDATPQARRDVVDVAKCQNCHGKNDGLSLHGANRTDNVQLCVVCHNPNDTDLFMRPVDPDGTDNGVNTAATDGLEERPIDFKYMIHAIHGAAKRNAENPSDPLIVYGYGVRPNDFSDVRFPRPASDCQACHVNDSYQLPLGSNVLGTTFDSGATVTATVTGFSNPGATAFAPGDGSVSDPTDDGNATATAAVCSSCHDSDAAKAHMEATGSGVLGLNVPLMTQANLPIEACAACHGPGRSESLDKVHDIE